MLGMNEKMNVEYMDNDWIDRNPTEFDDYESNFFSERSIGYPNKIFLAMVLDKGVRKNEIFDFNIDYLKTPGCYLFFDSYEHLYPPIVLPLYVGRTNNLRNRLGNQYHTENNFLASYFSDLDCNSDDLFRKDIIVPEDQHFMGFPSVHIRVAIWIQGSDKERMFLEHELIYKCRPIYNRD